MMEIFRKKSGIFILIIACCVVLSLVIVTLPKDGDYQYDVYMNDGTIVHAWSVSTEGSTIYIEPPRGEGGGYYLSQNQFKKIVNVGCMNQKSDK
jgi:hypothetical protein